MLTELESEQQISNRRLPEIVEADTQHGADAARNTVAYSHAKNEAQRLVGDSSETTAHRIELLEVLAEKSEGADRAQSLVAAAELCEDLGNREDARRLFSDAFEHDSLNVVAIRSLRRYAIETSDWPAAVALLRAELELPLGNADKALAWIMLGEILARHENSHSDALAAFRTCAQLHAGQCNGELVAI